MSATPPSSPVRRIAHLDMDAFFASVALLQYPQLQGLPMVIGGSRMSTAELLDAIHRKHPDGPRWQLDALDQIPPEYFPRLGDYRGRGVSTTATYAARQFGLSSGMGLTRAAQLCPQAILLPVEFDRYRHYSREFKRIIVSVAPVMEDRGIDEVYIDFSALPGVDADGGEALARLIQQRIFEATQLWCSIGVAPNKLLAKMASEFDKPCGISIVFPDDLEKKIWPLPCRKINGIGPKTDARLQALGIQTIGELASRDPAWLVEHFGQRHGLWLHHSAWGRDERPVVAERSAPVSISRETTFARDLHPVHDRAELGQIFTRLAEQTAADLARKGYEGRTIGIKLRYADFRIVTRDQTIDDYIADARRIRRVAGLCLKRVDLSRRLRLLGIRISSLRPHDPADDALAADNADDAAALQRSSAKPDSTDTARNRAEPVAPHSPSHSSVQSPPRSSSASSASHTVAPSSGSRPDRHHRAAPHDPQQGELPF